MPNRTVFPFRLSVLWVGIPQSGSVTGVPVASEVAKRATVGGSLVGCIVGVRSPLVPANKAVGNSRIQLKVIYTY